MLTYLIFATVLPALIMGYPQRACPDGLPTPIAIRILGCDSSPCMVVPGSYMYYEADYINPSFTNTLGFRAFLTIFGIETEVPLDNNDGCTKSTEQCPHTAGLFITVAEQVRIPTLPPGIPATLRARMDNDDGNFMCSELNGFTVAPSSESTMEF